MQILGDVLEQRQGGVSDATFRLIDDSFKTHPVIGIFHNAHIGDDIPDFLAVVETSAAVDTVRHAAAHQRTLQHIGLGVHPVQNRMVAVFRTLFHVLKDFLGDICRFVGLVRSLIPGDLLPCAGIRPEVFGLSAVVVGNHAVGGIQNVLGGTIVLFQTNYGTLRKFLFESQNVLDRRTTETVDALVIITYYTEVAAGMGQQRDQLVLCVVGILVLVHQNVRETVLILCQFLRESPEQFYRQINDIVKIQCIGGTQMLLVYTVQLCNHHLSIVTAGIFQHLCRRDHGILCPADLLDHTAGRELFFRHIHVRKAVLHQPPCIICIVNGKVAVIPQQGDAPAQDAHARRVKSRRIDRCGDLLPQRTCQSGTHFSRRFIGKSDRKNIPRANRCNRQNLTQAFHICLRFSVYVILQPHSILFRQKAVCLGIAVSEIDHVDNAADDCRCFAAPCAGKHQHRTVYGENGFLLLFVQRTEVCLKCLSFQRNALLFCHVFLSLLSQYCLRCLASVWFYQGICPNVGHAFIIPYSAAFEKMHCKLFTIFRCRILFQENIMLIFSCFFA